MKGLPIFRFALRPESLKPTLRASTRHKRIGIPITGARTLYTAGAGTKPPEKG